MTVDEWANSLKAKLQRIESGEALFLAAGGLVSDMEVRIFEKGLNVKGNKSSYNTTTEMWIGDSGSPKQGSHIGKTGKKIKTTYYPSYASYRSAMGRETSFVNFKLNNELFSDFITSLNVKSPNNIELKFKKDLSAEKRSGLEDKFGEIFTPTDAEVEQLVTTIQDEINIILQG